MILLERKIVAIPIIQENNKANAHHRGKPKKNNGDEIDE